MNEGSIPVLTPAQVIEHLEKCRACRGRYASCNTVQELLQQMPAEELELLIVIFANDQIARKHIRNEIIRRSQNSMEILKKSLSTKGKRSLECKSEEPVIKVLKQDQISVDNVAAVVNNPKPLRFIQKCEFCPVLCDTQAKLIEHENSCAQNPDNIVTSTEIPPTAISSTKTPPTPIPFKLPSKVLVKKNARYDFLFSGMNVIIKKEKKETPGSFDDQFATLIYFMNPEFFKAHQTPIMRETETIICYYYDTVLQKVCQRKEYVVDILSNNKKLLCQSCPEITFLPNDNKEEIEELIYNLAVSHEENHLNVEESVKNVTKLLEESSLTFGDGIGSKMELNESYHDPDIRINFENLYKQANVKEQGETRKVDADGREIIQEFNYFEDAKGITHIIEKLKNGLCRSYGAERQYFVCLGCRSSANGHIRKATRLYLSDDKKTAFIDTGHTCLLRDYEKEMKSYVISKVLGGEYFDIEKFGKRKYTKGQYELHEYVVADKIKKKLIIFDSKNRNLCFEFFCDSYGRFYCLGCSEGGQINQKRQRRLKADIEGEIVYCADEHLCELREYQKVIKAVKDVKKEIIKPPGFEIIHYTADNKKNKKLIIFLDDNEEDDAKRKCRIYRHHKEHFYCHGCANEGKTTAADVVEQDGEINVVATIQHYKCCVPKDYEEEIARWSDATLIKPAQYEIVISKKGVPNLHVFSDASKERGYVMGKKRKGYRCYSCKSNLTETYGRILEGSGDLRMFGEHSCYPVVLNQKRSILGGKIKIIPNWLSHNEGIEELKEWKMSQIGKLGAEQVMTTHYLLSVAGPTKPVIEIISGAYYLGYAMNHLNRANNHGNGWEQVFKEYDNVWLYPVMIAPSCITREAEATGIALFQAGSLPMPLTNKQKGQFQTYDAKNNVFVIGEIAANTENPKHKSLASAYKRYLWNALSSPKMKEMAVNVKEVARINKLPYTEPICFW